MKIFPPLLFWLFSVTALGQSSLLQELVIDSVVHRDMELSQAPGAMVLVKKDGVTLFEKAYGLRNARSADPVTPSTLFLTASVTKTLTTAALLTVCKAKGISTDTPVGEILPGLPEDLAELTLHRILSQSSGILDHWPSRKKWKSDPRTYFMHFGNRLLSKELEGVYSYTNFGHVLAGWILSELHEKPFEEAMRDVLLDPLGMDHTTYSVVGENWQNHAAAHRNGKVVEHEYTFPLIRSSASMFSTAEDLSKFAECFMGKGNYQGEQVMPEEVVMMMSEQYTPVGVLHNYFGYPGSFYGYGLMTFSFGGIAFQGHPGETTTQNLLFAMAPDHKTSIVIMSNSGMFPFIETFETLCNVYLSEDSDKMAVQDSGLQSGTDRAQWFDEENPAFDLEEYEGTYYHPSLGGSRGQVLEVYESNKNLYLQPSEDETYKLIPLQKDLFSYASPRFNFDVEIRFFRDSQRRVKYLNHYWKTAVRSGR